jgi:hypothetical protein
VIAAEAPGSDSVGHGAAIRALAPLLADPAGAAAELAVEVVALFSAAGTTREAGWPTPLSA